MRTTSLMAFYATITVVCAIPALAQTELQEDLPELSMEPPVVGFAGSSTFTGLPVFQGESDPIGELLPEDPVSVGTLALAPGRNTAGVICPTQGGLSKGSPFSVLTGPLALTDEQYEKFYSVRNQFLDKVGPKMVDLSNLKRQLKDTLTSPEIDSSKAKSLGNKIASLKAELTNLRTDRTIALANVLTSDQRKALRQAMIKGSCPGGGDSRIMRRLMMKDHRPQF